MNVYIHGFCIQSPFPSPAIIVGNSGGYCDEVRSLHIKLKYDWRNVVIRHKVGNLNIGRWLDIFSHFTDITTADYADIRFF